MTFHLATPFLILVIQDLNFMEILKELVKPVETGVVKLLRATVSKLVFFIKNYKFSLNIKLWLNSEDLKPEKNC